MRRAFLLLLLLVCFSTGVDAQERRQVGRLVMEGVPEDIPSRITETLKNYRDLKSAFFESWDISNGGMYISTRLGDVTQIYYVADPGSEPVQMTDYKEPVRTAYTSRDPARDGFVFYKDNGGDENYQMYYYDKSTGNSELITDGKSRNSNFGFNKDGSKYVLRSNRADGKSFDFYMGEFGVPGSEKMFMDNEGGGWGMIDWSDNGKHLLIREYISSTESRIYLYDIAESKLEQINLQDGQISYGGAEFSIDGKGIFIISDEGTEFDVLRYYDFGTKEFELLTVDIPWDVGGLTMSDDGNKLVFTSNESGFEKLYIMDTKTKEYKQVPGLPPAGISSLQFHPDNRRVGFTMRTATTGSDVYVLDTEDMNVTRWTKSERGSLDPAIFVEPELLMYPFYIDDIGVERNIPAVYYKPRNTTGKVPVVILVHGGPASQSTPLFSSYVQYLVNEMGVAVIRPNVRGSSGYGKSYLEMDDGYRREESVDDIGSLLDWIAGQPDLDAKRVAIRGGSYGGYMVLASLVRYSDRIKCGIDVVGISNFVTFLENTSDYRRDLRRTEYGDERDPDMRAFLEKISPANNVDKITSPLFIVQGKNDPRVPLSEAEQMLEALKKNGKTVWYLMAEDEGHGFSKKPNRDFQTAAEILFFEKYLLN